MCDVVGPRYTPVKISTISYLFVSFFFFDTLVIMGDTELPRYTGFHGLSVRSITALQCNSINVKYEHLECRTLMNGSKSSTRPRENSYPGVT